MNEPAICRHKLKHQKSKKNFRTYQNNIQPFHFGIVILAVIIYAFPIFF